MGPGSYYSPGPVRARRRSSPWPWIVLTLVLGIGMSFLLVPIGSHVPGFTNTVTEAPHSFTVGAHPTIVITNDIGTIHVRAGGTGSDVTIQATKHTAAGTDVNATDVRYNQNKTHNTITHGMRNEMHSSLK